MLLLTVLKYLPKSLFTMKSLRHHFGARLGIGLRCFASTSTTFNSISSHADKPVIKIPKRIERSPTDILEALASTVGRDYTAPHYRFHDDPYLIPVSNSNKRAFSLSKESGKKTAKWVVQEHPELFMHRVAKPDIPAFWPKPVITPESEVNESTLRSLLDQGLLHEALKAYELIQNKSIELSSETKLEFLQYLCFYNEIEPLDEDLIEERWYRAGISSRDKIKLTWKSDGIAEKIFKELEEGEFGLKASLALIRGRAKYYDVDGAFNLFKDVEGRGLPIDIETYNAIICITRFMRENHELRWELITGTLNGMEQNGVVPNIRTLNAILQNLAYLGNPGAAKKHSRSSLAEFARLGIEPSLASYYYLLLIYCKERGPTSTILNDIMSEVKGKSFKICDPKDIFFFITAMDVCRSHLKDVQLADDVHALLQVGNNYDLIGDSFKESIYYRNYFALKVESEPFEQFMDLYNKYVPNIYTPEPGITEAILKGLEVSGCIEYIPQFWSDIIIFDQGFRENILTLILQIMSMGISMIDPTENGKKLITKFGDIGWQIWKRIEGQDKERQNLAKWSGVMISHLITVLIRADEFSKAEEVIKRILRNSEDILGSPDLNSLSLFIETATEKNNMTICLACLQYISDCGYEGIHQLGENLRSSEKLDPVQLARLNNLVGFDFNKKEKVEESSAV